MYHLLTSSSEIIMMMARYYVWTKILCSIVCIQDIMVSADLQERLFLLLWNRLYSPFPLLPPRTLQMTKNLTLMISMVTFDPSISSTAAVSNASASCVSAWGYHHRGIGLPPSVSCHILHWKIVPQIVISPRKKMSCLGTLAIFVK